MGIRDATDAITRKWNYAPPPWRMFDAIVDERDRWLHLLDDEVQVEVYEAQRPDVVVLAPWVNPLVVTTTVAISADGLSGSNLRITARLDGADVPLKEKVWIKYRLGMLFGQELRDWVDDQIDRDWLRNHRSPPR
jgi:hypothetical protein